MHIWLTLAAAAVVVALLILGRLRKNSLPYRHLSVLLKLRWYLKPAETAPLVVKEQIPEPVAAVKKTSVPSEKKVLPAAEREQIVNIAPVMVKARTETPVIIAGIDARKLLAVKFNEIPAPVNIPEREENWIMKGIAGLSRAIKKEKTPVDGYTFAKSCINGINSVFGSEMELEKVISKDGDTVGVSFNSSLLSFSAPVRKSSQ